MEVAGVTSCEIGSWIVSERWCYVLSRGAFGSIGTTLSLTTPLSFPVSLLTIFRRSRFSSSIIVVSLLERALGSLISSLNPESGFSFPNRISYIPNRTSLSRVGVFLFSESDFRISEPDFRTRFPNRFQNPNQISSFPELGFALTLLSRIGFRVGKSFDFRVGTRFPSRNSASPTLRFPNRKTVSSEPGFACLVLLPSMTTNLSHSNPISVVLNGNNYILWNHHMTILLKSHGLYSYVTGTTVAPTRTANESAIDYAKRVNEWDINNAKILGFINASTTAEINQQFLGYTATKGLWDFLTKRYSSTGLAHQYQLWTTFQSKRQLPDQPVSSYISEMQAIRDHLNLGSSQVHDNTAKLYQAYFNQLHLITILMGLLDKFENVRASLLHRHPLLSLEDAITELLSEETRFQLHTPASALSESVFHTSTSSSSSKGKVFQKTYNRPPGFQNSYNKPPELPYNKSSGKPSGNECTFCHSPSHFLVNCPIRRCKHCGIQHPHHLLSECSQNLKKHQTAVRFVAQHEPTGMPAAAPISSNPELMELMRRNQELMAQIMTGSLGMNSQHSAPSGTLWIFDSGCFNHMSPCPNGFVSKRRSSHPTIRMADLTPKSVLFEGDVSTDNVQLPEDPKTKQTLGVGRRVGRVLEVVYIRIPLQSHSVVASISQPSSLDLWHDRLGHLSSSRIKLLASSGSLGHVTPSNISCLPCKVGKHHALPFEINESQSSCSFDLIHSDVWGPAPHPSMGELPQLYITFARMIQTQLSKPIKILRANNAMEYKESSLLAFLRSQGTIPQYSCPGTSPQNGRAKRKHRHILDTVRTLLVSAKCPERFWGEAAFTAVYTINRHPTPILQHKSPYEVLHGISPAYNLLKVWGCYRCWDPISKCLRISRNVTFWEDVPFYTMPNTESSITPTAPYFTDPSLPFDTPISPPIPTTVPDSPTTTSDPSPPVPTPSPTPEAPAESTDPGPSTSETVRRSDWVRQVPAHLRDYHCYATLLSNHKPTSYKEAASSAHWQEAMQEELRALAKAQTWDPVPLSPDKRPIGSKWVFKIKTKSDGSIDRLLAIAATKHWPLFQMDVKNAFLNGDLSEEVYMTPPPGVFLPSGHACRLRKALYGLKQAPRAWFEKFSNTFMRLKVRAEKNPRNFDLLRFDRLHRSLDRLSFREIMEVRSTIQGEIDLIHLRKLARMPKDAVIKSPGEVRPADAPAGFFALFEYPFKIGFIWPYSPLSRAFMTRFSLSPGQLMPQFWRVVSVIERMTENWGRAPFTVDDLLTAYTVKVSDYDRYGIYPKGRGDAMLVHENEFSFEESTEAVNRFLEYGVQERSYAGSKGKSPREDSDEELEVQVLSEEEVEEEEMEGQKKPSKKLANMAAAKRALEKKKGVSGMEPQLKKTRSSSGASISSKDATRQADDVVDATPIHSVPPPTMSPTMPKEKRAPVKSSKGKEGETSINISLPSNFLDGDVINQDDLFPAIEQYLLPSQKAHMDTRRISELDAGAVGYSFMAFQACLGLHQRLETVQRDMKMKMSSERAAVNEAKKAKEKASKMAADLEAKRVEADDLMAKLDEAEHVRSDQRARLTAANNRIVKLEEELAALRMEMADREKASSSEIQDLKDEMVLSRMVARAALIRQFIGGTYTIEAAKGELGAFRDAMGSDELLDADDAKDADEEEEGDEKSKEAEVTMIEEEDKNEDASGSGIVDKAVEVIPPIVEVSVGEGAGIEATPEV
ncbi:hypothetical protein OSB04_000717 [Centaurea solstitialis]|uniref:Integrase catalytic domain-containing protein n=1 Tax=Centaurea solstitialis TaxID=347529 RepID=A0AA38U299_9ASTR|nr:hypothetical protein OSB04_000717 [Centaurea solstitialis]